MLEKDKDNIECEVCKKKEMVDSVAGPWYCSLPAGWYYTDSYPPGDMGILYCCSEECVEKFNNMDDKLY